MCIYHKYILGSNSCDKFQPPKANNLYIYDTSGFYLWSFELEMVPDTSSPHICQIWSEYVKEA